MINDKIKCRLYSSFHNMPFSISIKILWTDVLPGLGLASISLQTVPSSPVSIRWFSTSGSPFVVNDNFFPFCPGLIYNIQL